MIPFNKASISELEQKYVQDALQNSKLSGDGKYTMRVYEQLNGTFGFGECIADHQRHHGFGDGLAVD